MENVVGLICELAHAGEAGDGKSLYIQLTMLCELGQKNRAAVQSRVKNFRTLKQY